jgi:putative PIN family toxin of toxin-antitoxin system
MISLRLVVDTNIVISAALKPEGLQRTILVLALTKPAKLFVSPSIIEEYRDVLSRRKLQIRKGLQQQLMQLINKRARHVIPPRHLEVTADPDDNKFVECADVARADYLITGNIADFPRYWKKTKIITSREFLGIVAPHILA